MMLPTPTVEYGLLSPMLIVFGAAVAGVLVEAFLPRRNRYSAQLVLTLGGLVAAFVAVVVLARDMHGGAGQIAVMGAVAVDPPALFLQGTILLIGILGILLIAERRLPGPDSDDGAAGLDAFTPQAAAVAGSVAEKVATRAGMVQTEVFPLTMFAIGGMLLFPAADDLLTMFIALEVLSLPLYLLCGLARRRRLLSQEAALKYFLLGAFSSAFFLYGIALLYGYSGTLSLVGISEAMRAQSGDTRLALIGVGLVAVGVLFKVGAVPFHSWIPDVYQGAPTPITAFMAAATKIAAFGAMLRIFYVAVPGPTGRLAPGDVGDRDPHDGGGHRHRRHADRRQTHAGVFGGGPCGFHPDRCHRAHRQRPVRHAVLPVRLRLLARWARSRWSAWCATPPARRTPRWRTGPASVGAIPLSAVVFSMFLLAFAGIPLTSGFVAKFAVFKAAGEGGAIPLVIVGVIASAIAAYFYVRVIVLMFFTDPPADAPEVVRPSWTSTATVTLTAAVTLALGALPQPLLDLVNNSAQFVR